MATIDQVTAWNSSKPKSAGYYQYDGDSGGFVFYGADGNVAPDPYADPIEGYLKQFYDPETDTYDIPGVGKVNYAGPWSTSQNLKAFGPMSTPETFRAGMFKDGGQVIDTPYGPAFVGVSRGDAPEGSAEPGAGLGGLIVNGLAGAALGGIGLHSGLLGGAAPSVANTSGALAGDFASSFAPTLTEAGLSTAANQALIPTLGEIAGTSSLGLPAGGWEAVLGTSGAAGAGGTAGLDQILSGYNPMGDYGEYGGYTAANTVPTGTAATGAGAGAGSTASSALSRILGGNASTQDYLSLAGQLGSLGLGVYGANQQANATSDLYDRFFSLGAPYRQSLAALEANPQGFYSSPMVQGALQQGSDALSRSLSAKVGNPILNPTALQEMQNFTTRGLLDAYNNRFSQLASAGQLGVSQSAGLGSQAAASQSGIPNALGAGLSSVFGKEQDYAQQVLDLLKNRSSFSGMSLA